MKKLLRLFLVFFKIGLFTFGGGYAMLSLIDNEVVEKKKWLSAEELSDIFAVGESTPGPIAINCATYIGYKQCGVLGSIMATLGVILPSLIIIYVISLFLNTFLEIELIAKAFKGVQCAVAVLIFNAGIKLFKSIKKNWLSFVLLSLAFALSLIIDIFAIKISTIYMILFGGIIGFLCYSLIGLDDSGKPRLKKSLDKGGNQ